MTGRRPTQADIATLARALTAPTPAPDYKGYAGFLTALLFEVTTPARPKPAGRPRAHTAEFYRELLDWFAKLKAYEERAQGRELTDKQCIDAFAKRCRGHMKVSPKTIQNLLADARRIHAVAS
jgi:hypothetical protein